MTFNVSDALQAKALSLRVEDTENSLDMSLALGSSVRFNPSNESCELSQQFFIKNAASQMTLYEVTLTVSSRHTLARERARRGFTSNNGIETEEEVTSHQCILVRVESKSNRWHNSSAFSPMGLCGYVMLWNAVMMSEEKKFFDGARYRFDFKGLSHAVFYLCAIKYFTLYF